MIAEPEGLQRLLEIHTVLVKGEAGEGALSDPHFRTFLAQPPSSRAAQARAPKLLAPCSFAAL